jgi:maltose-binding protein MalE
VRVGVLASGAGTDHPELFAFRSWGEVQEYVEDDESYQFDDLIPTVRDALSVEGKLYAAPFYAESSFVMYRQDVLEDAGLVVARRSGREKLHFLNPVPIRLIHDRWIDKYTERRVAALTDLKTELEGKEQP